jgi:hypothetical protein
MPAVLTAAGAAGCAAWGVAGSGPSGAVVGVIGGAFAFGVAFALAVTRRTLVRCLVAPVLSTLAFAGVIVLVDAVESGRSPNAGPMLKQLLNLDTLPWLIAPPLALAYCHDRFEGLGAARFGVLRALIFYPLVLTIAAFVALALTRTGRGEGVWFFAMLGASQPLGMEAVLRISAALRRRA